MREYNWTHNSNFYKATQVGVGKDNQKSLRFIIVFGFTSGTFIHEAFI